MTLAARAAIRAVGRALDAPYSVQDSIAKMIPMEVGMTIEKALEVNLDLKYKYDTDEKIKYLIDIALAVEGLPLTTSTHAAGVLVTDRKGVTEHVPVYVNKDAIVAQFDMGILEELGMLKLDFLGLRTLGVISRAIKMIQKNHGVTLDLNELYKGEDLKPFELLPKGFTQGIFQLEGAMASFIKEMQPQNIEELTAAISLYRPGPMDSIPQYLANRRNPSNVTYKLKGLEGILGATFGLLVYQEQCMKTVIEVAGYDKSDSDSFRKVISKKQLKLLPLHRKWFTEGRKKIDIDEYGKEKDYGHAIPGGLKLGHNLKDLEDFFDNMEEFGKYAFNKSHKMCVAHHSDMVVKTN